MTKGKDNVLPSGSSIYGNSSDNLRHQNVGGGVLGDANLVAVLEDMQSKVMESCTRMIGWHDEEHKDSPGKLVSTVAMRARIGNGFHFYSVLFKTS